MAAKEIETELLDAANAMRDAWIAAWVWVDFSGTDLDKDPTSCGYRARERNQQ